MVTLPENIPSSENLSKEELSNLWEELKPYVLTTKTALGVIVIIFSLVYSFDTVSKKWAAYNRANERVEQREKTKQGLSKQEAQLNDLATQFDSLGATVIHIQQGQSPQIAVFDVAQHVITIAEEAGNTYIDLKPLGAGTIDIAPAVASITTLFASGGSTPTPNRKNAGELVNVFNYTIHIKGSYAGLAQFLHQLSQEPNFILVKRVDLLHRQATSNRYAAVAPQTNPNELELKLDFSIPWR